MVISGFNPLLYYEFEHEDGPNNTHPPHSFHTYQTGTSAHVGRYAIVPVTVKPLHSAEAFTLDLTADNTVEWEQTDDIFRDLDQELRVR